MHPKRVVEKTFQNCRQADSPPDTYVFDLGSHHWVATLCKTSGSALPVNTNSFVSEAIALESAIEFIDGIL